MPRKAPWRRGARTSAALGLQIQPCLGRIHCTQIPQAGDPADSASLTLIPCPPASAACAGSVNWGLCLDQTIWDDFLHHCPTGVQTHWECWEDPSSTPPKPLPTCSPMAPPLQRVPSLSLSRKGKYSPLCSESIPGECCLPTPEHKAPLQGGAELGGGVEDNRGCSSRHSSIDLSPSSCQ